MLTYGAGLFHLKTKRSGLPLTAFVKGGDGGDVSIPGGYASGFASFSFVCYDNLSKANLCRCIQGNSFCCGSLPSSNIAGI